MTLNKNSQVLARPTLLTILSRKRWQQWLNDKLIAAYGEGVSDGQHWVSESLIDYDYEAAKFAASI